MNRISALQPNTTQIPNYLIDQVMPKISPVAFQVLMVIARQTYGWIGDPMTGHRKQRDWISRSQFKEKTGKQNEAIQNALKELEKLRLIQVTDAEGIFLLTENRAGRQIYYSIQTFPEIGQVDEKVTENRNSEIGQTKETNTKVLSKDNSSVAKKQPSCPLLNGSSLREKYPNGHTECIEYYLSVENRRGGKFINQPKQFNCIHKILRAGYGFDEMNKVFPKIEKKYGKGNWDFGTLANWLEKGALNG